MQPVLLSSVPAAGQGSPGSGGGGGGGVTAVVTFPLDVDNGEKIPIEFSNLILTEYVVPSERPSMVRLVAG
jgi:hypothetical protein